MTISSGPTSQIAVHTGGLDIQALMRHAAIKGSIVMFPNLLQSSAQVSTRSCDAAVLSAAKRGNDANTAPNLTCRALIEAEDVMRRSNHGLDRAFDRPERAGKATRGLFP